MGQPGVLSLVGKTIAGKYAIVRRIAAGSMGEVYEGRGPRGEAVAVKSMSAAAQDLMGEEARARFARECSISTGLRHPNVVSVLDGGYDEELGLGYLAMALMDGEDLERCLARTGPLPAPVAARIVVEAARGLAAAHALGIVHRDIKPANLFLHREGGALVVKVCDFGVSKLAGGGVSEITSTRSALGSPLYMSPEQLLSPKLVDHRADVWGLGMVLYYALNGAPAFETSITLPALAIALTSNGVPPLRDTAPWVPEPVAAIVHRALSRDLDKRWPSAEAFAAALEPLALPGPLTPSVIVGVPLAARGELPGPRSVVPKSERAPASLEGAGVRIGGKYVLDRLLAPLPHGALYAGRRGASTPCEIATFEGAGSARAEAILGRARAFRELQGSYSFGVVDAGVDGADATDGVGARVFVVTEPPQGTPLSARLEKGPLDLRAACRIFGDVAAALSLFHARGLVHGHLSPDAIFLGANGGAKLGGLHYGDPTAIAGDEEEGAQLADAPPTPVARYMSPEQARRSTVLTPATDVWSLCVCLHEALSGKKPYANAPSLGALILMLCTQAVPSTERLKNVPPRLRQVLDAGLQRGPAERKVEVRQIGAVLQELGADTDEVDTLPPTVRAPHAAMREPAPAVAAERSIEASREVERPREAPAARTLRMLPVLLGAVAAGLLFTIAWLLLR